MFLVCSLLFLDGLLKDRALERLEALPVDVVVLQVAVEGLGSE